MLSLVTDLFLFILALIMMIGIAAIIGIVIVWVGVLIEEGKENYDGFFHRVFDAIEDTLYL